MLPLLSAFPSHWSDFFPLLQRYFIICLYPRADGIGNLTQPHQSSSFCCLFCSLSSAGSRVGTNPPQSLIFPLSPPYSWIPSREFHLLPGPAGGSQAVPKGKVDPQQSLASHRGIFTWKREGESGRAPRELTGVKTGMEREKKKRDLDWAELWSVWSLENPWCLKKPFLLLFQLNFLLSSF